MIITMEACFLHSNFLIKSAEIVPSVKTRFPIKNIGRRCQSTKSSRLNYVACCQLGSNSSSSPEEIDWRNFRARLIAKEQINATAENQQPPPNSAAAAAAGDNKWAHTIYEPEKGCLLIATEKLDGVHIFEKTVVLLLSTGRVGPMGLILNRPSLMSIKEMKSSRFDVGGTFSDRPLFFGGPLEDGLFLVSPKRVDEWAGKDGGVFEEIMNGLYYGNKESIGLASEMVKRKALEIGDFRFFDGYCAWDNEQLRDEIRSGYWTVAACSPSVIGLSSVGSVGLWEEIIGLMGPRKVW